MSDILNIEVGARREQPAPGFPAGACSMISVIVPVFNEEDKMSRPCAPTCCACCAAWASASSSSRSTTAAATLGRAARPGRRRAGAEGHPPGPQLRADRGADGRHRPCPRRRHRADRRRSAKRSRGHPARCSPSSTRATTSSPAGEGPQGRRIRRNFVSRVANC